MLFNPDSSFKSNSLFGIFNQSILGVVGIKRRVITDDRGFFSKLFCSDELKEIGWIWPVSQINHSFTALKGAIRGMHYQTPPHSEAKIVTCIRGAVWDVALDVRQGSPTFLKWCALELTEENGIAMIIPPGCAHGFQTCNDNSEIIYLHSSPYASKFEECINPLDPMISIRWPLPLTIMSDKDRQSPLIDAAFAGVFL